MPYLIPRRDRFRYRPGESPGFLYRLKSGHIGSDTDRFLPGLHLIMDLRLAPMLPPTVPSAVVIPVVISSYRGEILHLPFRKRLPAYESVTAFSALVRAT